MKFHEKNKTIFGSATDWYRDLALIDLIKEIVESDDKKALEEFHDNRTIFQVPGKGWICLTGYLNHLRETATIVRWKLGNAFERADRAYDMALDKFCNLPKRSGCADETPSDDAQLKPSGANCHLYFKAFLGYITRKLKDSPPKGPLDEELKVANALQKFVKRHFYLALLDAERNNNPFWSRYFWEINGSKLCLWMPKFIKGHQRRKWLVKNIPEPDPGRPAERERIQSIINRSFAYMAFVPLDENRSHQGNKPFPPEDIAQKPFETTLAMAVAGEKAANIDHQRRAIKKLGKSKIKQLVLEIFENIEDDNIKDRELSKKFGLSKATFSRFSGSRWYKSETGTVPDLWRNTAHVLAMDPDFKATVIAAGAWEQVLTVLKQPQ